MINFGKQQLTNLNFTDMCLKLCLLATSMTRSIKAAATSYVVCVVKNIESNEKYFSAKEP